MKVYFVRHGESEANLANEFSNRGINYPLTERGRQQAHQLAQSLRGISIATIYHSPVLRAVQTAEILASELQLPREETEALREFDVGVLEGRSDKASWDLHFEICDAWVRDRDFARAAEGGESFLDMQRRFVPFVEQVVKTHEPRGENVLLLAHGGLYRNMLPMVLTNIELNSAITKSIDYGTLIEAETTGAGLVCRAWGQTRF